MKLTYIGKVSELPKKDLVEILRREDITQTTKMSIAVELIRRANKLIHFDWILEILGNCFKECDLCDTLSDNVLEIEVFQPFDNSGIVYKLCEGCHDELDHTAHFCEGCSRHIFNTNKRRINIRFNEEEEGFYCVSCLHKEWFDNGMENFKDADFFLDSRLIEHGFTKHDSYFCRASSDYKFAEIDFIDLQKEGFKVIVNITRSGMGFEHYFDIWTKKSEEACRSTNCGDYGECVGCLEYNECIKEEEASA